MSANDPQRRVLFIPGEVEGDERRPGGSYAASLLLSQTRESLESDRPQMRGVYQIRDTPGT